MDDCDYDYLAYGQRSRPHDVPASAGSRPSPALGTETNGLPPGFIPTGEAATDQYLIEMYRLKASGAPAYLLDAMNASSRPKASNRLNENDIPELPPLPEAVGFVPTGDGKLDEVLLFDYLETHGTAAEQAELKRVLDRRMKALQARQRIASKRMTQVLRTKDAVAAHFDSLPRPRGL